MSCLFCVYFQPIEPPLHQRQREAGTCPDGCNKDRWDHAAALNYVKSTQQYVDGYCRQEPTEKLRSCGYVCAKIEPINARTGPLRYGFLIPARLVGESLHEWAETLMRHWVHGRYDGWRRRAEKAEADNETLTRQLRVARERSAARLARLKVLEGKKEPKRRIKKPLAMTGLGAPAVVPVPEEVPEEARLPEAAD